MSLSLPGSQNIFSTMQNALATKSGGRVALHKGVHDTLDDFQWMHQHIAICPTRIADLVPLPPVADRHHDASGAGVGEIWFPSPAITAHHGYTKTQPVAWLFQWPQMIIDHLVIGKKPTVPLQTQIWSWQPSSYCYWSLRR